jgi:hypothetical protein
LGAGIGCLLAYISAITGMIFYPSAGALLAGLSVIAFASAILAYFARNTLIPAIVWNLGLAILSYGAVYFLADYLFPRGLAL